MAHLVTGYAGQAHIKSADEGAFNASFFGSEQYVMEYGNEFEGSIIDNNTVRIAEGEGLMYGRHFRVEAPEDLTITTGKAGTNRIDLICMTYEKNANDETEKVYLQVIKGTEATGTPTVPKHTNGNILEGASFNQMPLYKVRMDGVVLSRIEAVFETIPSYKGLAKMYADRFANACEELKSQFELTNILKTTDVVDNLTSDSTTKPLSARMGKELNINKLDASLLENPAYITTGIEPVSGRVTVISGGYYKVGKLCVVELKVRLLIDVSASRWEILTGLPEAKCVGMGAGVCEGKKGPSVIFISDNGQLYVYNTANYNIGEVLNIGVVYTTE